LTIGTLSLFFLVLLGFQTSFAFEIPKLTGPVIDEAHLLEREDHRELERTLAQINQKGLAQVQVAILKSLQGEAVESASIKLVEAWKLGDGKKDNGVLFLISVDDKKMRIEVGQGFEGAIPDVEAKRILADQVRPLFKARQFSAGIVVGVHEILRRIDNEYAQASEDPKIEKKSLRGNWMFFVYIFIFIIFTLMRGGLRSGIRRRHGILGGGGFGGGGWGRGGASGGWSGGGGGFSGGGASSDW